MQLDHETRANALEALVRHGVELERAERVLVLLARCDDESELATAFRMFLESKPAETIPSNGTRRGLTRDLRELARSTAFWGARTYALCEQLEHELTPELAQTLTLTVRQLVRTHGRLSQELERRRAPRLQ